MASSQNAKGYPVAEHSGVEKETEGPGIRINIINVWTTLDINHKTTLKTKITIKDFLLIYLTLSQIYLANKSVKYCI